MLEGNLDILRRYVDIELKNGNLIVATEYLQQLLAQLDNNIETHMRLLMSFLSLNQYKKALILSKSIEEKWPNSINVLLIRSSLYINNFEMPDLGQKYLENAMRWKKRELGLIQKISPDNDYQPYTQVELSSIQIDEMWLSLSKLLVDNYFSDLTDIYMVYIKDTESLEYKKLRIRLLMIKKQYKEALEIVQELIRRHL